MTAKPQDPASLRKAAEAAFKSARPTLGIPVAPSPPPKTEGAAAAPKAAPRFAPKRLAPYSAERIKEIADRAEAGVHTREGGAASSPARGVKVAPKAAVQKVQK